MRGTFSLGALMNSDRLQAIAGQIHNNVEIGLWAALLAFVVYFVAFVAPNMPAAQARAERLRIQEIAAEHDFYCEKFGMPTGTPVHAQCVLDLGAFRATIEKRIADENDVF